MTANVLGSSGTTSPHPEERREVAVSPRERRKRLQRLEGWQPAPRLWPTLRDAALRTAPQGEVVVVRRSAPRSELVVVSRAAPRDEVVVRPAGSGADAHRQRADAAQEVGVDAHRFADD